MKQYRVGPISSSMHPLDVNKQTYNVGQVQN